MIKLQPVNHKTLLIGKIELICTPACKQKNAILALTPTLDLTQTVTLALINPNINLKPNLKSKPQLTTKNNNFKK